MLRLVACAALALTAVPASALPLAPAHNPLLDRLGAADASIRLTGPVTTTATSGSGGTSNGLLTSENVGGAGDGWRPAHGILSRISIAEAGDNPCAIGAVYWSARAAFAWGETDYAVACDNETGFRHSDEGYGRRLAGRAPSQSTPTAIHGLQVCTNQRDGRNLKLKGLRVFMAHVDQDGDGEVTPDPGLTSEFERPNCREPWSRVVTCPAGQVGVGLTVYYHNGQNDRGRNAQSNPDRITGLALQCRAVSVVRPQPVIDRGALSRG